MSTLLMDEPPLVVQPGLAVALGLEGALLLQQVHYWANKAAEREDGRRWVYNTVQQWAEQFPFWSERTVRRLLADLKKSGVLLVEEFNAQRGDRTPFYAIDYEVLAGIGVQTPSARTRGPSGQNARMVRPNHADHPAKLAASYKEQETTTETTTETTALALLSGSENQLQKPKQSRSRKASEKISFQQFTELLGDDEDPISPGVYALAAQLGLPHDRDGDWVGPPSDVDFLELAWRRFALYFAPRTEKNAAMLGAAGAGAGKRYADWRAHFRNAVEGCWGGLWAFGRDGEAYLTTTGRQLAVAVGLRERAAA
jgi:hypothetical protein